MVVAVPVVVGVLVTVAVTVIVGVGVGVSLGHGYVPHADKSPKLFILLIIPLTTSTTYIG